MDKREQLYNTLCDMVDRILVGSPVRRICIKCSTVEPYMRDGGGLGCCTGCKYLGSKGCTTKSLACKLWQCDIELFRNLSESDRLFISIIRRIAYEKGFYYPRGNYQDVLDYEEKNGERIYY